MARNAAGAKAQPDAPRKEVQVWFAGASAARPVRADGCFVGSLGELKLSVGHDLVTIIAPGAWTFVQLR